MPNFKQAPKLFHNKSKFNSNNYYNLPQELMDSVFSQLDGKCGNQIKLMIVLLGTLGNGSFAVSEKWICDRTGMVQQTYSTARKALIERGWIYLEEGTIYVLPSIILYGFPFPEGISEEERRRIKIATISNCVNEIKSQYSVKQTQYDIVKQTQYDIVQQAQDDIEYNIINNKIKETNNILDNPSSLTSRCLIPMFIPEEVKVDGEISRETAEMILEKEYISPTLIQTATGKIFKIMED